MKKILAFVLVLCIVLSLTACGKSETMEEFKTDATIEKTVIYDADNVKITANSLTYTTYSAELSVTLENNSNTDLSFICGSYGYHVNSVNGYMIDDGYLNCDVPAGETAEDTISFDFVSLSVNGITSIADMEIGFDISDDDYHSIYTGPLSIKTSIADTYDYSTNHYQKIIENGAFENEYECTVNYFSSDDLYSENDVCITSAALITNNSNEPVLLLEIENQSSAAVYTSIKKVHMNETLVYESLWSSSSINANKNYVTDISLSSLVNQYKGDPSDVSNINRLSFTFEIGENWYDVANSKEITVELPNITLTSEETAQ